MKQAGIIGGTSWHSTEDLYRYVNSRVAERLGGNNCARLAVINVNMQDILDADGPDGKGAILARAARAAEAAGSDFVVICSNGLHEYAPYVIGAVDIPFVHIADSTAAAILSCGLKKVGFMAVKATIERDFYLKRLRSHGLEVLVPGPAELEYMDNVLFNEVCMGVIKTESQQRFYEIAESLADKGAEGVILGCTEIGELMQQEHTRLRLFDTTQIHAQAIAELCMYD